MRPPKGLNKKWSLGEVVALVKEVDRALVVCCGEGGGGGVGGRNYLTSLT